MTDVDIDLAVTGLTQQEVLSSLTNTHKQGAALLVKKLGDTIYVGYKLDANYDHFWVFEASGINNLYSINYSHLMANTGAEVIDHDFTSSPKYLGTVDTDWNGPYVCRNDGGTGSTRFTGGHHGSNGDETGDPTARSAGYTVSVDTGGLVDGEPIRCGKVLISTINYVQCYDDPLRETLKQTIHTTITDVGISNHFITDILLNDVVMTKFYGPQVYAPGTLFGDVRYIGDLTALGLAQASDVTSGATVQTSCNTVIHTTLDDKYCLTSYVNAGQLGNFLYAGSTAQRAFRSNSKTYFTLVGWTRNLPIGSRIEVTGGYSFATRCGSSPASNELGSIVITPLGDKVKIIADGYKLDGSEKEGVLSVPMSVRGKPVLASTGLTANTSADEFTGETFRLRSLDTNAEFSLIV